MCRNPMADDDDSMPLSEDANISAVKEALFAQQQLLQKLYNELDAEREASASAASEALAVILRLQGEKAAVKMEAEHYKRLAEEKMCHAEESLALIQDAVYHKEMEVAALDYQVQAYRCKLLSMGYVDHGFGGVKSVDNFVQRNEGLVGETSEGSIGRRHSAPMSWRGKGTLVKERDLVRGGVEGKLVEEGLDSGKNIDSYWEKIRKLDERVKEIAGGNYTSSNSRSETRSPSSSLSSRVSRGSSCDSTENEGGLCQPKKMMDGNNEATSSDGVAAAVAAAAAAADNSCSVSVHDVYEVPQAEGRCESREKDEIKGRSGSIEKDNVILPEAVKMRARDEPEWLEKVLQSSKLSQASDVECRLVIAPVATSIDQFSSTINQVGGRVEIVEDERAVESSSREEEVKLLHEIKEKVDLLHDEIRSLKGKKKSSSMREEESSLAMALLSEAMLSFWL